MNNLQITMNAYLDFCQSQKRLDSKTLKAYRIDLNQFLRFCSELPISQITDISPDNLEHFISTLHTSYKPKTVKRKIASIKAFFHYLEYRDLISLNPFNRLQIKFREPITLPRTIPLHTIELLLSTMYRQRSAAKTQFQKRTILRDIAVIELLFSTGMRISELCSLQALDVNLYDQTILIHGKASKERRIQIGSSAVISILQEYQQTYVNEIAACGFFFTSPSGSPLSDQVVRRMINKYAALASIDQHITPHMFRHTFATSLLEADVDIRYIQEMLGHSSINITEIYTHVAMAKQRDILTTKHPRKDFMI